MKILIVDSDGQVFASHKVDAKAEFNKAVDLEKQGITGTMYSHFATALHQILDDVMGDAKAVMQVEVKDCVCGPQLARMVRNAVDEFQKI